MPPKAEKSLGNLQKKLDIAHTVDYNVKEHGPVAQLGERSVRIREVEGSNPFESTTKSREIIDFAAFLQLL